MSKFEIVNKMSRSINRAGFKIRKHSPEIMVVTGIVGVVTSTVLACKATTKVSKIIDEHNETMNNIHHCAELGYVPTGGEDMIEYTEEDAKKETVITYAQTGVKFAKIYGPAVLLGTLSITSILTGHNILRKRNIALAAAYATVDKGFKEYRKNVIDRFGKDLDYELLHNIKAKEVEEIVTDEKTGEEKVVKSVVDLPDESSLGSPYARFFDPTCDHWSKDSEANLTFLRRQQDWANDVLKRKGYLFLNDVYDMLGISKSVAGQSVGWIYDEKNPTGDNFVDFGLDNIKSEPTRRFVNGYENMVMLDFNVDGPILESGIFEA